MEVNSKRGKLTIFCGSLESGGAERVISILSKPFADEFDKVIILTWHHRPIFYKFDARVKIVSLPELGAKNGYLSKLKTFRKYLTKNRPDLLLSFLTPYNLLAIVSLLGSGINMVVAERNDPRYTPGGKPVIWAMKYLYGKADGVLCQTESIKSFFPVKVQKNTKIIYNPVIMKSDKAGKALRSTKKNRIVSVGRLHHQKNQKLLIDAFSIFHKSHPEYILSIYGKGEMEVELSTYIAKLGLSDSVTLEGEKKEVMDLILDAKAFVMTSDFEGMPNALIEAMCLGLPCISTKVSGAIDLIETGKNGILTERNAIQISDRIEEVVENESLADQIGHNASQLYDSMNVNHISNIWVDYLKSKFNIEPNCDV